MPPTTTTGPTSDAPASDVLALDVPASDVPASDGPASDTLVLDGLVDVGVPFAPPAVAGLGDDALLAASRQVAQVRRRADAVAAVVAAEIARRSRRELGHHGLAQRLGVRTPERLVQQVAGVTRSEAHTYVRVGQLTLPTTPDPTTPDLVSPDPASPGVSPDPAMLGVSPDLPSWLSAVADAVRAGTLSLTAADVIRSGLGTPREGVPAETLARAATALVEAAGTLTVERLAAEARMVRDDLDQAGVADRARILRDRRYLTLTDLPDGMTRLTGLLDPESAAQVRAVYDAATSPRRGGPRFVDPTTRTRTDQILHDPRSTGQIACDTLIHLITAGAATDPDQILPTKHPDVVVHVTLTDLDRRHGTGHIDGQTASVPISTIERRICTAGALPILFDHDGTVLDVGRSQRLFTPRQRTALAARDGGCRFPGCDRPPSWTEAHHIKPWTHGGTTNLNNGILLCRHHHLLTHDNGWDIHPPDTTPGATPGTTEWVIIPPADIDPQRQPIPMPPHGIAARRNTH